MWKCGHTYVLECTLYKNITVYHKINRHINTTHTSVKMLTKGNITSLISNTARNLCVPGLEWGGSHDFIQTIPDVFLPIAEEKKHDDASEIFVGE